MNIEASLFQYSGKKVFLAFSGGSDSSALAYALKAVGAYVTCVYIDHGWNDLGRQWISTCELMANQLGFDFMHFSIKAKNIVGEGLEDSSRNGRYQIFSSLLKKDDIMLTAQHMDDQAETLLIQLFRGGGVAGLAGMPLRKKLGEGYLERPWLSASKLDIEKYAKEHNIQSIEDPSNACEDMDRNFIRHRVLPVIKLHRWSNPSAMISRSADNIRVSLEVEKDWYDMKKNSVIINGHISLRQLRMMDEALIGTFIKYWIAEQSTVKIPSKERISAIVKAIVKNNGVIIQWEGGAISIRKGTIYLQDNTNSTDEDTMEINR